MSGSLLVFFHGSFIRPGLCTFLASLPALLLVFSLLFTLDFPCSLPGIPSISQFMLLLSLILRKLCFATASVKIKQKRQEEMVLSRMVK
mmetsp:Transcript_64332/g.73859  ORF Transcript_64332/g.73859 Transcript_64332/m.73859 type:complete len:89 (+) Transcript_64332:1069-1335(+)